MPDEFWGFPNAATPAGSAFYYVARFSSPRQRNKVASWLAWFAHIDQIASKAKDPGVSRLKLDWWREEASLALQDKARHPIAQALSASISSDWQVEQMQRALDAIEQRILHCQPADTAHFTRQCEALWGSRMGLLAQADSPSLRQWSDTAGRYYGVVEQLQYLARDIQRDYLPLPRDGPELDIERLQSREHIPALATLGEELLQDAESAWEAVRPRTLGHPAFDPVLRLSAQARRSARLLRRCAFQTHRQTQLPTPLGLLWSAWRRR